MQNKIYILTKAEAFDLKHSEVFFLISFYVVFIFSPDILACSCICFHGRYVHSRFASASED